MIQQNQNVTKLNRNWSRSTFEIEPLKSCFILSFFLTRNIVRPPEKNIRGRNSLSPLKQSFFPDTFPFQNFGLKVVLPEERIPPPAPPVDTARRLRDFSSYKLLLLRCYILTLIGTSRYL